MTLSAQEIIAILPHRYPFLLVDQVIEIEPGRRIVAIKTITQNEPWSSGHFPEHSIFPPVLLLEMIAQSGGITLMIDGRNVGKPAYLMEVKNAIFHRVVFPGEVLRAEVIIIRSRAGMDWLRGSITIEQESVCECEFSVVESAVVSGS